MRYDLELLRRNEEVRMAGRRGGHQVVIVTGDRFATMPVWGLVVWWAIHETVWDADTWTLCHGGARGIDGIADMVARRMEPPPSKIRIYEADWSMGRRAGPVRNGRMLREAHEASIQHGFPLTVLAFHDDLQPGGGTYDCVQQARARHIPVFHYASDGSCVRWGNEAAARQRPAHLGAHGRDQEAPAGVRQHRLHH